MTDQTAGHGEKLARAIEVRDSIATRIDEWLRSLRIEPRTP